MGQEEVTVLIILVHLDLERRCLHATFRLHRLRLRFLLGKQGVDTQLAELQVGLHTEQGGTSVDQGVAGGHADVTGLQRLDDLILLTRIGQFQLLGIEIKRGLGVVVHIEVDLRSDRGLHIQLDTLVEIKIGPFPRALRQRRVVILVRLQSHRDLGRSLRTHPDTSRTEQTIRRADIKLHIGQVKLVTHRVPVLLLVLLAEIGTQRLLESIILELLGRQRHWRADLHIAQLGPHDVGSGLDVVVDRGLHVLRIPQVGRRLSDNILILLGRGLRNWITSRHRILLSLRQQLQLRQGRGKSREICVQGIQSHPKQKYGEPNEIFNQAFPHLRTEKMC